MSSPVEGMPTQSERAVELARSLCRRLDEPDAGAARLLADATVRPCRCFDGACDESPCAAALFDAWLSDRPHAKELGAFAWSLGARRREDRDDLLQLTYFRAWRYHRSYHPERTTSALAWLKTILRNANVGAARPPEEPIDAEQDLSAPDGSPPDPIGHRRLAECLTELGGRARSVLGLLFHDESSEQDVADRLGLSSRHVVGRLKRSAIAFLHECMTRREAARE